MFVRTSPLAHAAWILTLILTPVICAQDINKLKSGVVRIENGKFADEVGTGFIVKIDDTRVYIVTAAHVVRGSKRHSVYLFSQQHEPLSATVIDREEDDTKGLAILLLKVDRQTSAKLTALKLRNTSDLGNGESVRILGFPGGTSLWTVDSGTVKRLEGRNLVLSGAVRAGSSGGPVILDERAIGLVTDVSQSDAYAARAESIIPYVNGIVPTLTSTDTIVDTRPSDKVSSDEFCRVLNELLDASKDGFTSVKGAATTSEDTYYPTVKFPGSDGGYVLPRKELYYYLLSTTDKDTAERQFSSVASKVRGCLPTWREKEEATYYRYRIFSGPMGKTRVRVFYNPDPQTNNGKHSLLFSILISD